MGIIEIIAAWVGEHRVILLAIASLSFALCLAVIAALPLVIICLPCDYFLREEFIPPRDSPARGPIARGRRTAGRYHHPLVAFLLLLLKNVAGAVFLLAGFVFLFTPGQGLLTIFAGLLLLNFPGKRRLELAIIRKPAILRAANWIRARSGKAPFELPA